MNGVEGRLGLSAERFLPRVATEIFGLLDPPNSVVDVFAGEVGLTPDPRSPAAKEPGNGGGTSMPRSGGRGEMVSEEGHTETGPCFGWAGPPTSMGLRRYLFGALQTKGQLVDPSGVPVGKGH